MASALPHSVARPLIVVSVGTDHHRFDRLVRWTEHYASQHPELRFVVQRGTSNTPRALESHELIPHDELRGLFADASVVICHGGPSTVMDARSVGRKPIVVPRDPELAEHVDGHQVRFARHLSDHRMAVVVWSEAEFFTALDEALIDPATMTIPIAAKSVPVGVANVGRVLDDLLGVETPIERVAAPPLTVHRGFKS